MEENLDKITQVFVAILALGVLGFLLTVASVALFGPQMIPFLRLLPYPLL
ncbi:MAG: hypothetical protein ACM3SR_13075 [Ignavibacteriales bacterium]